MRRTIQYRISSPAPKRMATIAKKRCAKTFMAGQTRASKPSCSVEIQRGKSGNGRRKIPFRLRIACRIPRVQRYRCCTRSNHDSGASLQAIAESSYSTRQPAASILSVRSASSAKVSVS